MEASYLNDRIEVLILYFSDMERQFKNMASTLEQFAKAVIKDGGTTRLNRGLEERLNSLSSLSGFSVDMVAQPEPQPIQGRNGEVESRGAGYEGGQIYQCKI